MSVGAPSTVAGWTRKPWAPNDDGSKLGLKSIFLVHDRHRIVGIDWRVEQIDETTSLGRHRRDRGQVPIRMVEIFVTVIPTLPLRIRWRVQPKEQQ